MDSLPIEILGLIYVFAQPTLIEIDKFPIELEYNYRYPKVVLCMVDKRFETAFKMYAKCVLFKHVSTRNYIKLNDETIKKLTFIKSVSLSCHGSVSFEGIKDLPLLKSLYIRGNVTVNSIIELTNIRNIGIYQNDKLTNENLRYLTNLNKLGFYQNLKITTIPNPERITNLYLCESICLDCISKMVNLKKLSLNGSVWNFRPDFIMGLANIKTLNLSDTGFSSIGNLRDDNLSKMTDITSLNLSNNHFITDNGLRNLTNLTELNLEHNNLITKNSFKNLPNLCKVYA